MNNGNFLTLAEDLDLQISVYPLLFVIEIMTGLIDQSYHKPSEDRYRSGSMSI